MAGEVPTVDSDLDQVVGPEVGLEEPGRGDEEPVGREPEGQVAVGPGDESGLPEAPGTTDQRLGGLGAVGAGTGGGAQGARSKTIRPPTSVRSQRPVTAVPLNGELRLLENEVVTS